MNAPALAASLAGLDPNAVGVQNLRAALDHAMARTGLDETAYLALLAAGPRERRLLAGRAVVQETWLMRDPAAFEELARLAPLLPSPLRVLCVPCATGEEPASVAATLARAGIALSDFSVDAADASPEALAAARLGRFGPSCLRGDQPPPGAPLLESGGEIVLDPQVLARIRFIEADVLDEGFLADEAPYHAIFCRNLLIYLNAWARRRLAANLSRLLAPGGALFTSPAEAAAFAALGLSPHMRRDAPRAQAARHAPAPGTLGTPDTAARPRAEEARDAQATQAAPHEPDAARLARSLADSGRVREALPAIEAALDSEGPSAALYHLKGAALLALGEAGLAGEAFRRAVYLEPGHVEALTHLELLARAEGRPGEADVLAGRVRRAQEARS